MTTTTTYQLNEGESLYLVLISSSKMNDPVGEVQKWLEQEEMTWFCALLTENDANEFVKRAMHSMRAHYYIIRFRINKKCNLTIILSGILEQVFHNPVEVKDIVSAEELILHTF